MPKKDLIEKHRSISNNWEKELSKLEYLSLRQGSNKNSVNFYYDSSKYFAKFALFKLCQSFGKTGRIYDASKNKSILPGISVAFGPQSIDTIIRPSLAQKRPLIYVDHPYFGNNYNRPSISENLYNENDVLTFNFRLIYNQPHQTTILNYPEDRFQSFKIKLNDWQINDSGHILICPPSGRMDDLLNVNRKWLIKTIKTIRKKSDRKILIRPKPNSIPQSYWFELEKTVENLSIRNKVKFNNINDDLVNCWAVVAPASNVSIQAVISGIPVFCENTSPTKLIGLQDYSQIEAPIYPDRLPLLSSLAYCQFSIDEMISGYAKSILEKNIKLWH